MTAHGSDRGRLIWTELGLVLMVTIWGLNFAVVKWALAAIEPMGFNALRHLLASLFMLVVLRLSEGGPRPRRRDLPRIAALGVIGLVLYQLAFIFGVERTRAGNASLMLALVPVFLLVLGGASHWRVRSWVGALGSVTGVALVSGGTVRLEGSAAVVGDLMLIGAAAMWAIYTIGAQPLIERYGSIRTTAWTLWTGSGLLVLAGLPALSRQDWSLVGVAEWAGLLFSSVLSIGLAYLLWYRGVQRLGGARTAVFSNLTPVVTLVAGALWLGEQPTPLTVLGAVLVIGGIVLVRGGPRPVPASAVAR